MTPWRPLYNQSGSSLLIGLIILAVILAIYGAAYDYMISSARELKRAEMALARTRIESVVASFLTSPDMCNTSLTGKQISTDANGGKFITVNKLVSGSGSKSPTIYDSSRDKSDSSQDHLDRAVLLSNLMAETESVIIENLRVRAGDPPDLWSGVFSYRLSYRPGVVSPPGEPLPAWAAIKPIEFGIQLRSANGVDVLGCEIDQSNTALSPTGPYCLSLGLTADCTPVTP